MVSAAFLDSGAYSAFSKGHEIDIHEYIQFIKDHDDIFETYANLDVIGNPEETWKNQKIMEKAGLHPLPTFHYNEDIKWLKKYLKKYGHIALGGMVPVSTKNIHIWLDFLFDRYLTDKSGRPKYKIHGFGVNGVRTIWRYPWFSVDATTWIRNGALGRVLIPKPKAGGGFNYKKSPFVVTMSQREPIMKQQNNIKTLSPNIQKYVIDYIQEKGFSLGKSHFKRVLSSYKLRKNEYWHKKGTEIEIITERGLMNDHACRKLLCLIYFIDLGDAIPKDHRFQRSKFYGLGDLFK